MKIYVENRRLTCGQCDKFRLDDPFSGEGCRTMKGVDVTRGQKVCEEYYMPEQAEVAEVGR